MKTFSTLGAAVLIGLLSITAAIAGNMAARFGNTVLATYPDGSTTKFYYNKDGTFAAKAEKAGKTTTETTGAWRQDADKVCITAKSTIGAFQAGKELCVALGGDKVGDKWTVTTKGPDGKDITVQVTIVAGHV